MGRGFTPDRPPLVGTWTARQLVLAGFKRAWQYEYVHGRTNTYMAAEHVLHGIVGDEDWLAPLDPRRFDRRKGDSS